VATGQLQVVDVMSAELDELTRVLTDAIHEHLDELDDDLRVMTAQSVRANLGLIVVMLREGAAPASAVAPEEARSYVREYVRRGLGTEVLQRAYRTAQAALSHLVLNRVRVLTDDPDDLVTLAGDFNDFLFAWVEELERQILAVYLREREDWVRGATAQRAALVRTILDGARIDVTATSRRLEYELERPHVGYVIWAPDDESEAPTAEMRRMAAAVAEALLARDSLIVELGPHLACWSTAGSRPAPARLTGLPRFTGLGATIGTPARGVDGFRLSHQEALMARRVARLAGSSEAFTPYSDVALESLALHDVDEARRFVERELGPLVADDAAARRMSATIRIFLEESSSFVRAARRLGVHENTVAYRVRRAEELMGRPLAGRRLEVSMALRLSDLLRRSSHEAAD
jgi:hypothetical protein